MNGWGAAKEWGENSCWLCAATTSTRTTMAPTSNASYSSISIEVALRSTKEVPKVQDEVDP